MSGLGRGGPTNWFGPPAKSGILHVTFSNLESQGRRKSILLRGGRGGETGGEQGRGLAETNKKGRKKSREGERKKRGL